MNDQYFADLVLAERTARIEWEADQSNAQKFDAWYAAAGEKSKELRNRQDRHFAESLQQVAQRQ